MRIAETLFVAVIMVAGLSLSAQEGSRPASTNVLNAQYPRVHEDGRVTLRLSAPNARQVQLQPGGADNGLGKGPIDMTRDEKGVWTLTIPPAVPGFHYYWFLVDGLAVNDPGSDHFFGWGRMTSGIEVPDKNGRYYEMQDVPHGEVRIRPYFSKVTGAWRRALVYTPPGYDRETKTRYPVLYLQHGAGENESGWTRQGRAHVILDNLIAAGAARPMVVVMDHGYATGSGAATPAPGGTPQPNAFADVVINDLIPTIDANYRTKTDRGNRAMAGLSMGGGQTLQIASAHLDTFAWIGSFSAPMRNFDPKTSMNGVLADPAGFNERVRLFWIGAGTAEVPFHQAASQLHKTLEALGVKHVFYQAEGTSHEWQTWRKSLHDFASRLFK